MPVCAGTDDNAVGATNGRYWPRCHIFSYNGTVRLGVITDVNRVSDPHQIIDGFHDEFDMLLALVEEEGKVAPINAPRIDKGQHALQLKAQPGTEFCHVHQQELVAA